MSEPILLVVPIVATFVWLWGAFFPDMPGGIWTHLTWPLWLPLFCLSRSGRWARASMRALRKDMPTILRLMAGREAPPSEQRSCESDRIPAVIRGWPGPTCSGRPPKPNQRPFVRGVPTPPPAPPAWTDTGYAIVMPSGRAVPMTPELVGDMCLPPDDGAAPRGEKP